MTLQCDAPTAATQKKTTLLKRGLAAGLAVTGTAAVALGLYGYHAETFHHDTARLLQDIASAKGIHTSAAGVLSFDGRLSYEHVGLQYNFTVLNDKGFVTVQNATTGQLTRSECLVKDNLPPLSMLTDALTHARVVDAVAKPQFDVTCASGKLIEIFFADEPYVFCSSSTGSLAVTGEDLSASIQLLQDNAETVALSAASLTIPASLNPATCGALSAVSTTTTPATRSLTDARDAVTVARGERRMAAMGASECGCTDGLKKCLFVHGLGYSAGPTTATFKDYFGSIKTQAKCCSEVKFLHIDTVGKTWYDDASADALCTEAAAMAGATDKMAIENVAIVAHSMGNLVFQAALMNNKCGLAKSSKYIAFNGPIYGSASAASAVTILSSLPKTIQDRLCFNDPNTVIDDPIVNALLFFGLCPTREAISSIVSKGAKASTPELDALFTAAGVSYATSVSSNLCGVSPIGLLTTDSIQLSILGTVSGHASLENDGQVHYDSCRATLDKSTYATSWNGGKFYKAGINHLDGTSRRRLVGQRSQAHQVVQLPVLSTGRPWWVCRARSRGDVRRERHPSCCVSRCTVTWQAPWLERGGLLYERRGRGARRGVTGRTLMRRPGTTSSILLGPPVLESGYQLGLDMLHENLPDVKEIRTEHVFPKGGSAAANAAQLTLVLDPPVEELRTKHYKAFKTFVARPNRFPGFGNKNVFAVMCDANAQNLLSVLWFARGQQHV